MNLIRSRAENFRFHIRAFVALSLVAIGIGASATAQEVTLQVDPSKSSVKFTLGDVLHTVRGTFTAKRGMLRFDPGMGKVSGEIVVNAESGESGSGMRDRKMHKEILESDRYPEISFRPDRIEGAVSESGKSSVKVHGVFSIHGVDREITGTRRGGDFRRSLDRDRALHCPLREVGHEESEHAIPAGQRFGGD
jgi:polyisoprenoid-binding protein YceI